MPYYVYILKSLKDGRYYIGQTADIDQRIAMHNKKQCRATKAYVPWRLVYVETFKLRKDAIRRERSIKQRKRRAYIESLI